MRQNQVDALGDLSSLKNRDTTFAVISRAPLAKLEAYKAQKRWIIAWFSSFESEFNYDFHVTLDARVAPVEYNYRNQAETGEKMGRAVTLEGEHHGLSVLFRADSDIFHSTWSSLGAANRCRMLIAFWTRLRTDGQQGFEDSPPGWPQKPTYC
jgi:predicted dithiol-disulfide oxidoreductase (DUF899 family)